LNEYELEKLQDCCVNENDNEIEGFKDENWLCFRSDQELLNILNPDPQFNIIEMTAWDSNAKIWTTQTAKQRISMEKPKDYSTII